MPTRQIANAGVVTFGADPTADWQSVGGDLSGDWLNTAHWSTGAVPGMDDDVVISDDGTATSPWTVMATNELVSALTLTMNLGTLAVTGGISVANNLVQNAGTLFAEALAGIALGGSLVQAGGSMVLNDDGESFTPFSSSGTDTVDGQVTLVNGANWTDLGLDIGTGLSGSTIAVSAGFTLEGGLAPGQLVVALGPMQIGADPSSGSAGGSGTLVSDKGSGVTADSLALLDHSVVSVDSQGFVVIGPAASADPGSVALEGGAGIVADIATFDSGVVNDGTLSVTAWEGDGVTAPGDVLITGTLFSGDVVTVAAQATLTVDDVIELLGGSMTVGSGGTLVADQAANSFGMDLDGGAVTLDGGTLSSLGSVDFANGNAALLDGALWSTRSLELAPGFGNTISVNATLALSGGSTVSDANGFFAGSAGGGSVGVVQLSGASTLRASEAELANGSQLSLDPTSSVMVGAALADPGAVAIAAGGLFAADSATIDANVFDLGTFDVTPFNGAASGSPIDVRVSGSLTGAGEVFVNGTLSLGDASNFNGTIGIAGGGELILDAGELADGLVLPSSGPGGGEPVIIDVVGQSFDASGFAPTYSAFTGLLVFGDATSQSTVDVGTGRALGDFSLAAAGSGTLITTEAPCFVAGTRIRTSRGEVAVEDLRVGDRVATPNGHWRKVVWLGHLHVDCRRHRRPDAVWPVRIQADAFGVGMPRRDVLMSPDHAVFLMGDGAAQGVLIPVRYLVNDATIVHERVDSVDYWHVELVRHDVIVAEGLACESYLDTGNRAAFANAGEDVMPRPLLSHEVCPVSEPGAPLAANRLRPIDLRQAARFTLRPAPPTYPSGEDHGL